MPRAARLSDTNLGATVAGLERPGHRGVLHPAHSRRRPPAPSVFFLEAASPDCPPRGRPPRDRRRARSPTAAFKTVIEHHDGRPRHGGRAEAPTPNSWSRSTRLLSNDLLRHGRYFEPPAGDPQRYHPGLERTSADDCSTGLGGVGGVGAVYGGRHNGALDRWSDVLNRGRRPRWLDQTRSTNAANRRPGQHPLRPGLAAMVVPVSARAGPARVEVELRLRRQEPGHLHRRSVRLAQARRSCSARCAAASAKVRAAARSTGGRRGLGLTSCFGSLSHLISNRGRSDKRTEVIGPHGHSRPTFGPLRPAAGKRSNIFRGNGGMAHERHEHEVDRRAARAGDFAILGHGHQWRRVAPLIEKGGAPRRRPSPWGNLAGTWARAFTSTGVQGLAALPRRPCGEGCSVVFRALLARGGKAQTIGESSGLPRRLARSRSILCAPPTCAPSADGRGEEEVVRRRQERRSAPPPRAGAMRRWGDDGVRRSGGSRPYVEAAARTGPTPAAEA